MNRFSARLTKAGSARVDGCVAMGTRRHDGKGATGTAVVVFLVVVGLVAALVAWFYWTHGVSVSGSDGMSGGPYGRPVEPAPRPALTATSTRISTPALHPPYDREAALVALDQAAVKVNAMLAESDVGPAVEKLVGDLVERYPAFPEARTLLAQVLIRRGDTEAAYAQLARSLALEPAQPNIRELAGTVALNLGHMDEAADHFAAAIQTDPAETRYRLSLANVRLKQGRFDDARKELATVIRLDADEHRAYALLADVHAQQGALPEAMAQLAHAVQRVPEDDRRSLIAYTRKRALLLRRAGRPRDALQAFVSLYPAEREQLAVLGDIAICWDMLEQPGRAAEAYEQAFQKEPTQWPLMAEAARWYQRAGDHGAVTRCLDIVRTLNPRAPVLDELGTSAMTTQPVSP